MHRYLPKIAFGLALLVGAPTRGITVINNGLAPPEPENVLEHFMGSSTHVQNVGCNVNVADPCAAPGAPTTVDVRDFAALAGLDGPALAVHQSSTVEMIGGEVQTVYTFDSSTFEMSGGDITLVAELGDAPIGLFADDSSTVTIRGGSVGAVDYMEARGSSLVTIVGQNFAVNGTPVDFGILGLPEGAAIANLTGTLESGDPIAAYYGCYLIAPCTGLIVLMPEPAGSSAAT